VLYKGLVYNPYSRTDMDKGEGPKNLFDSTETVWNNMEKDHAILSPLLNSLTTYLFFYVFSGVLFILPNSVK
jgi:hypothetical protein